METQSAVSRRMSEIANVLKWLAMVFARWSRGMLLLF